MVGTVLAVEVGLKLPQAPELPQVTVQFTRAFGEPFEIVTATGVVVPAVMELGGSSPAVNARLGGGPELFPPQAASMAAIDAVSRRRSDRRKFTVHLRSRPACL